MRPSVLSSTGVLLCASDDAHDREPRERRLEQREAFADALQALDVELTQSEPAFLTFRKPSVAQRLARDRFQAILLGRN